MLSLREASLFLMIRYLFITTIILLREIVFPSVLLTEFVTFSIIIVHLSIRMSSRAICDVRLLSGDNFITPPVAGLISYGDVAAGRRFGIRVSPQRFDTIQKRCRASALQRASPVEGSGVEWHDVDF